MHLTMNDILSPAALVWAKIIGYGVFFVVVAFLLCVGLKLYCEGQTAYNHFRGYR